MITCSQPTLPGALSWRSAMLLLLFGVSVGVLFMAPRANAVSAEMTQSYAATTEIPSGTLVSIDDVEVKTVVVANQENSDRLVGVLAEKDSATIEMNSIDTSAVQVATSGRAMVLASTVNGEIKEGDVLCISAIAGIAGKAVPGGRIIGVAQQNFNTNSESVTLRTIKDKYGKSHQVAFGTIPIIVSIGGKVSVVETSSHNGLFGWFEALAGKSVSNIRLVICAFISAVTLIIMFIIIFSSIQSTIYGVSRNPFARASIFEAFAKVIVIALVIATLAMVIIYVILRV